MDYIDGGVLLALESRLSHELMLVLNAVKPGATSEWELLAGLQLATRQQMKARHMPFRSLINHILLKEENDAARLDEGLVG